MKTQLILGGLFALASLTISAAPVALESKALTVTLDSESPRILRYVSKADGAALEGQGSPAAVVELNGKPAACRVTFTSLGADSAQYRLAFSEAEIELTLVVSAGDYVVDWRFTEVRERGGTKLKTVAFPDNPFLTVRSSQTNAALAAVHCTNTRDQFTSTFREHLGELASLKAAADTGNYLFLSAGSLAAGIASSHAVDVERTAWKVVEKDGIKTLSAWCPSYFLREYDSEKAELPWAKVFITPDRNGDGRATWQDAALVYRAHMPKPLGHEFVRSTVGDNVAMNFASGAQQPFLRILDELKKCSLATDGLGQQVLIKGFSSEGHDSANTDYAGHWNERAGGLKDFTVLLERAHEYNARIGIHINASEVYPEVHRYNPDVLQRDAQGNPKPGWVWLDHAVMIDKRKDILSGNLFAALGEMRKALPKLDFVYVDTYWEHGWPAYKTATEINRLGLPMYTEGAGALDPWTPWAHWRQLNFTVMRFLWYSDRDICPNDPILRDGRSDEDGFMGWQNRHSFGSFIRSTFSRNLPAKFLKHFELLRWEPGKEAVFSDGVKVVKNGDAVVVTLNGRVVMTWTGGGANSRLFVPWDPRTASKIYVWDEVGTSQTWALPRGWEALSEVYSYKLTDLGRTEETRLPVTDGRVSLAVAKNTPFVLYPARAPAQAPVSWGEGSCVKDPGFDSHGFDWWNRGASAASYRIENDKNGNARLLMAGADGAGATVTQTLTGLVGGRTYAASVWVQVKGAREAALILEPNGAPAVSNGVARTTVRHSAPNDPRTGSNYQRVKVLFDVPAGQSTALLTLSAGSGAAGSEVEFDDVRIVEAKRSPEAAKHYFWEDFENVDQGYGPFTCCPGERTHLSEANPPYTRDTINGRFSLKSRDSGRVVRTLPSSLRLRPHTRYRLVCETLTDDKAGRNRLTVESGGRMVFDAKFPEGRGQIAGEFATTDDTESFVALYRSGGDMIAIDDLALDELGPAPK